MKIVSLVPSITETLFDFGLTEHQVAGRTKFCIHPAAKVKTVPVIGGTKNLHLDKITALKPDLIIANREENQKDQVEQLMKTGNVWVTDVGTLRDNEDFITLLGEKLGRPDVSAEYNHRISAVFSGLQPVRPLKVAYLIWKNPYMSIGTDTFIHEVLTRLGFQNVFAGYRRYPEVTPEMLEEADVIFLSSEPFPFSDRHATELREQFPGKTVITVDGEAFSWFGTHLAQCGPYFRELTARFS